MSTCASVSVRISSSANKPNSFFPLYATREKPEIGKRRINGKVLEQERTTTKKKCPVAYLLAYAHWPYLSVSNESYLFHEQARNQSTISFLANHQQWPVAYHLAYAHRPHQLIQYILLIFTSSQEPNQQFLIIQKGFF